MLVFLLAGATSCKGRCDEKYNSQNECHCNSKCGQYKNCCSDYADLCDGETKHVSPVADPVSRATQLHWSATFLSVDVALLWAAWLETEYRNLLQPLKPAYDALNFSKISKSVAVPPKRFSLQLIKWFKSLFEAQTLKRKQNLEKSPNLNTNCAEELYFIRHFSPINRLTTPKIYLTLCWGLTPRNHWTKLLHLEQLQ